ncbi:MAG: 4-alpha-glucanotransferase [Candidatus Auribacter fodinae]|jgi:4-alpha-glucanotransferase|uniref:4-alpha-glucanotransferase n=1 Tax=Candidatus Auribacter fodinae TaxID=2093366 RepID=A0A3A4R6L2_9BACT|nr:MAG: 4-alpha-glucanotransferase [Candidatus Auribacter fodinae]
MFAQRTSGILLHPTSLPSDFGIGDLGHTAYRFVDFLKETGQSLWQVLPLGHISYGNSPYMCLSAFGGNPYLISPQKMVDDGYLDLSDIERLHGFPDHRVDYGLVIDSKLRLFKKAFEKCRRKRYPDDYYRFCEEHSFWLEDYALFVSLKSAHYMKPWTLWEKGAAKRDPESLVRWRDKLAEDMEFWKFVQYLFFKQWNDLKQYCEENGISIIGDIPIYVAHDSAEVWANRDLFFLNDDGSPMVISGVPPDYFSSTGQRWGNPIYRWEKMEQRGFSWWIDRFKVNFSMVDMVRLDHFRGFEAYWEISAQEETAENGRWVKGPGRKLFDAVRTALGDVKLIAEDLGVITAEVDALRDDLNLPGMRILQMAFGSDPKAAEYRPHNHIRNCAVYTASHDHNTTVGWFTAEPGSQSTQSRGEIEAERELVKQYINTDGAQIQWDFIRLAMSSVARICLVPLQDVLGLGTEARMNLPGRPQGNWEWRFTDTMITSEIKHTLRQLTELYERSV